jgi:hypothetical protein
MRDLTLTASIYQLSSTFYSYELECVLQECVGIYNQIRTRAFSNNEEQIRDGFIEYLKDDDYKNAHEPLDRYQFDKEIGDGLGRLDIRILPVSPYQGDKAFYTIECKRLDNRNVTGISGLNAEYIKNGICRFVTNYYSSFYGCNAMFGFVVEEMDIAQNVSYINSLLSHDYVNQQEKRVCANAIQPLMYADYANGYAYSYVSKHKKEDENEILLYHLLFDFSHSIEDN